MLSLYRIVDWDRHFENNRTRELLDLKWVPVPNKHDGEGFLTIMQEPDGIIIYGCWHLILQVASKCRPRGTLLRDNRTPHTAASICRKTSFGDIPAMQRAIDFCSSLQVGWIEQVVGENYKIPQEGAGIPQEGALKGREGKGMEGKEEKGVSADKPPAARFTKPSIDEIRLYCQERKNQIEPQKFFDHYESNGWRVGKNPMKDWRAAVRTWERSEFQKPALPQEQKKAPPKKLLYYKPDYENEKLVYDPPMPEKK